jgi:hypothetical protein
MIEHTFISDWRHIAVPLGLTVAVIVGALVFAFG